jgi:hypothetical protein
MEDAVIDAANALLGVHALAGLRVAAWSSEREELTFEVFHVEWPAQIFGALKLAGVRYVQTPTTTSWGYRLSRPTAQRRAR